MFRYYKNDKFNLSLHKKYSIVQFLKINICSKDTTFAPEKEHLNPKRRET